MTAASTRPLVSILVTSFNRERYLAASIDSVLAQSYTNVEVIVSDNCSTDRSVAIARDYAQRDSRIQVTVNERNVGQFENRRRAAALARGEFLKYHDSDDVMYPHCVETMARALEGEPTAAVALSCGHHWPGGPCPMLLTPKLAYEREFLGGGVFHVGPGGAMFRTAAYRELGGFPSKGIASDYLFWLDVCTKVNVVLVPADLFYYRIHPDQEFSSPHADVEYAKAASAAWQKLHSAECPLDEVAREQAKRNYAWVRAREAYGHLKRRRFTAAGAVLAYAGMTPLDWFRYFRPARRSLSAGTPSHA